MAARWMHCSPRKSYFCIRWLLSLLMSIFRVCKLSWLWSRISQWKMFSLSGVMSLMITKSSDELILQRMAFCSRSGFQARSYGLNDRARGCQLIKYGTNHISSNFLEQTLKLITLLAANMRRYQARKCVIHKENIFIISELNWSLLTVISCNQKFHSL